MAGRIAEAQRAHAWLVLETGGAVVGYAYGGPFMSRAAYRWATTVSVYLDPERRGSGGGRALYEALFDRLAARGHRTALAGVALPHEAGVGPHPAPGLELARPHRPGGAELGRRHDVAWYQRPLGDGGDGPPELLH